jgi:hypothetical protein
MHSQSFSLDITHNISKQSLGVVKGREAAIKAKSTAGEQTSAGSTGAHAHTQQA